jgi:hypothetical protein
MPWYYFDIRDGDALYPDDEGLDLSDQRAAEVEAARSLAEMAKDLPVTEERHSMAIEVRTRDGPAFQAAFIYSAAPTRH